MSQNADLMDRLQEYEYITVQLEGENATIAEYIELYHNKRKALKEKIQEKDSFIDKLLKERSELEVSSWLNIKMDKCRWLDRLEDCYRLTVYRYYILVD